MAPSRQELVALVRQLAATPPGQRLALAPRALPLLADSKIPVATRIIGTARLLQLLPDRPGIVRRLTRALTAGLSPSRALERLRQVQHQLERTTALDELIEERERQVRMICPQCRIRLPFSDMVKHLWEVHELIVSRGRPLPLSWVIQEQQRHYLATGDAESLDRIAMLTGPTGLRKWLAQLVLSPDELALLQQAAAEKGAGICPGCFAEKPMPNSRLPKPLVLAKGRLAGENIIVEERSGRWFRRIRIQTGGTIRLDRLYTLTARGFAAVMCLVIFLIAIVMPTWWLSFIVLATALLVFGFAERLLAAVTPNDRVIDLAWSELVPEMTERAGSVCWLTRLCRASLDVGDPEVRGYWLRSVINRAAREAHNSELELQLFAAASVLQMTDESHYGRDRTAGIASLAARGLRGELPATFAESVVAVTLDVHPSPGELNRLRILLNEAAFEAGFVPQDFLDLWAGAPALGQVMAFDLPHRLALLFGLWQGRRQRRWESVAPAQTVFELANTAPHIATDLLTRYPDLLLVHLPPAEIEQLVGPLCVCSRGVAVGESILADVESRIELADGGRVLVLGRHKLHLQRQMPLEFLNVIRGYLRYWAKDLVESLEGSLGRGNTTLPHRLVRQLAQVCPSCGAVATIHCGALGRRLDSSSPSEVRPQLKKPSEPTPPQR
jgi:predicted RNA-binding Zn-ribbon protein involved in translation (DUF1610 family)